MVEWLTSAERRAAQEAQLKRRADVIARGAPKLAKALGGIQSEMAAKARPVKVGPVRPVDWDAEYAAARRKGLAAVVTVQRKHAEAQAAEAVKPERSKPARVELESDPAAFERALAYVEGLPPEQRQSLHLTEWFAGQSRSTQTALFDALAEVELRDESVDSAVADIVDETADRFYEQEEEGI